MTSLLRFCLLAIACTGLLMACSKQGAIDTAAPSPADESAPVAAPAAELPAAGVPATDLPALLEQAEALRQQAADLGHEWSNHAATISAAREALEAGNSADAARLASLAVLMGEQSVLQARTEAGRWRDAVPQ
jgi:hypothetical protein